MVQEQKICNDGAKGDGKYAESEGEGKKELKL